MGGRRPRPVCTTSSIVTCSRIGSMSGRVGGVPVVCVVRGPGRRRPARPSRGSLTPRRHPTSLPRGSAGTPRKSRSSATPARHSDLPRLGESLEGRCATSGGSGRLRVPSHSKAIRRNSAHTVVEVVPNHRSSCKPALVPIRVETARTHGSACISPSARVRGPRPDCYPHLPDGP